MTQQLRSAPDELDALVSATASAIGVSAEYVEKDFWATEVLRAACAERSISVQNGQVAPVTFVFKGGTSLSRVFRVTQRFSEDIDLLAVFPPGGSSQARHKVLKQVDLDVTTHLGIDGEVVDGSSKTGVKRYTTYRYATERSSGLLREGVLLELGSRGGAQPASLHPYTSMVAEFALSTLGEGPEAWEEFQPFPVLTLAPERTLLEKLSGLHTMVVSGDLEKLSKAGRHLYDVACLLGNATVIETLRQLGPTGVTALVADIESHSRDAGFASLPRPAGGFAASPVFNRTHELHSLVLKAYEAAMPLVHGPRPTSAQLLSIVQEHAELL